MGKEINLPTFLLVVPHIELYYLQLHFWWLAWPIPTTLQRLNLWCAGVVQVFVYLHYI